MRTANRAMMAGTALAALLTAGTASADVKAGVDAWARGDYAAAVHEWQGPAAAGDPDAMFNLGQAYRLGRGVTQDSAKAEELYARAAAKGHLQAADTYGLMLFQDGRHEAAIPYLEDAARRGDPRSEYLLGIAMFNGDAVPKDWVKAYALLTMANQHSLPQAQSALAQMDQLIPLDQRQQAAGLAVQMESEANRARGQALAAVDLGPSDAPTAAPVASPVRQAAPLAPTPKPASPRVAQQVATLAFSPSVEAAQRAVDQARQATGTESPAKAGASYARHSSRPVVAAAAAPTPSPAPSPVATATPSATPEPVLVAALPTATATPTPTPTSARTPTPARAPVAKAQPAVAAAAESKSPAPAPAAGASGSWRVQLGAFAVHANADKLWAALGGRSELAGKTMLKVPVGNVVRLQAGGYGTRDAAEDACRSLKSAGHDCIVTR